MKRRHGFVAAVVGLVGLLALAGPASAENWEKKATLPFSGYFSSIAVGSDGTVAYTSGNTAYRWTQSGGQQTIATVNFDCSVFVKGISDEGVIIGHKACWTSGGTAVTNTFLAWTPDSGNNPIEPLSGDITAAAIAPNGKFIGTNHNGTAFVYTDDKVVTGEANVAPVTGALLIGSSLAGSGAGIDIARDGTRLTSERTSDDLNVPSAFKRDGNTTGPFMIRASETGEGIFGLLPDERVLGRVTDGGSTDPDPSTDTAHLEYRAYDLSAETRIPMNAGGMTVPRNGDPIIGGGSKAFYSTGTGGGIPSGSAAIVAWSTPTSLPHALPAIFPTAMSGQAIVIPKASSDNGAWLVLSNGEVWFDTEWELGVPSGEKLTIPEKTKRYAFEQQQYYEGRIEYWQQKQKTTIGVVGPFAYFSPPILGTLAVGEIGQGVEFTVAIQNRDYWATVALDPPDPKWRTVASAPALHLAKIRRPRDISNTRFATVKSFIGARLELLANHVCAVDAINRGSTAVDEGDVAKAKAQYAAGARCSTRAIAAAKKAAGLAGKATPLIAKSVRKAPKLLKGMRKKKLTKAVWTREVNRRVAQITQLIDLPAPLVKKMKAELAGKRISKHSYDAYNALATEKGVKKDNSLSGGVGQVGDAFEKHAD